MPKDFEDHSVELARIKAERRWRNHDIEKRVKEERKIEPAPTKTEPHIAEVITTERRKPGSVVRAQTKFAKQIKSMLDEHKKRTTLLYRLSLLTQLRRLKREKLKRRLKELLAQLTQIEATKPKTRDLFS